MNEKKYVVPEGMLKAAEKRLKTCYGLADFAQMILEIAIRWLAENPIVPTLEQVEKISSVVMKSDRRGTADYYVEFQRIMFLAPEPDPDEPIKDLLGKAMAYTADCLSERVREAYRRGKAERP